MVLICGAHFNQHHLNKVGSWLTPVLTEPKFVFYELMVPVSPCHWDFFFFLANSESSDIYFTKFTKITNN